MAKKKRYIAKVGINLSDDSRFEAGDELPNLKPSDEAALIEMDAIEVAEEVSDDQ